MTRNAAIEAMARGMWQNSTGMEEWSNATRGARRHWTATATAALDALACWADTQGLALAVPRVATEGMHVAATARATDGAIWLGLYASIYAAMIAAAPDVLGVVE